MSLKIVPVGTATRRHSRISEIPVCHTVLISEYLGPYKLYFVWDGCAIEVADNGPTFSRKKSGIPVTTMFSIKKEISLREIEFKEVEKCSKAFLIMRGVIFFKVKSGGCGSNYYLINTETLEKVIISSNGKFRHLGFDDVEFHCS